MLQKLRDQTQNTGFRILVIAIILTLALFGFGATSLFSAPDPELAQVGDVEITQSKVAVATERERRRIMAQMGTDFDASSLDRQQLADFVLQQMITREIVYQTADNLGIKAPAAEVNRALLDGEAFQVGGQFDEAMYRQYVNVMGYTPAEFMDEFGRSLGAETLQDAVASSHLMADWEMAELVRVLNQRRDLAYLPLLTDEFGAELEVTQEEIELRYDEDANLYLTELQVDAEFITLSVDDMLDDPSIVVSEEDILQKYEDDRASALRDEQRDSSHILLQVNDDRDEAAALAQMQAIVQRLEAGEDFNTLAQELSEDAGTASLGGKLGPVGKGIFDPAFEEALWALEEEGQVSAPVLSDFGYHLIRLDEIVQSDYPSLESQRDQLVLEIKRVLAVDLFEEAARQLEDLAYDENSSLTATAEALELPLQTAQRLARGNEHPLLSQSKAQSALFSDDVLSGLNSSAIALGDEQVLVLRVGNQYPPELKPLDEVSADIERTLRREAAQERIAQAKEQGLARLRAGDSVAEIAEALGSAWQRVELASRTPRTAAEAQVPNEVRSFAFELPRPSPGDKSYGAVDMFNGAALVTVTRVVQGDDDATLAQELEQLRRAAAEQGASIDLQSFLQAAEADLGVQRPNVIASDS